MSNLVENSIQIILSNQSPSGAYIASPTFPTYQYCWFRDGSYIAYAMNLYNHSDSTAAFHNWAARAILDREDLIKHTIEKSQAGIQLTNEDFLHTRYTVNGSEAQTTDEDWPNHQLDGFGTWLWAVNQHIRITNSRPPDKWLRAGNLAADYLLALWQHPCYDCWEEFPDKIHTHTLSAIYGGLKAFQEISAVDYTAVLNTIRETIFSRHIYRGYFTKFAGSYTVDASLLGLALPYGLVSLNDPRFQETIARMEISLIRGGGVHRYPTDTYYGGGEWVLLTAWLGWCYAQSGAIDKAIKALTWIENQADANGYLAEQVPLSLNDPNYYHPWLEKWGTIASPLLWSHAMYLILSNSIQNRPGSPLVYGQDQMIGR